MRNEVLRLKARIGDIGVRNLAEAFNRRHGARETMGKTFVATLIQAHEYQIACLRRDLRSQPPKPYPCAIEAGLRGYPPTHDAARSA